MNKDTMETVRAVNFAVGLICLAGCQSGRVSAVNGNESPAVVTKSVEGGSRLFSRVGLYMIDDAVQNKIHRSYKDNGALDREKLKTLFLDAAIVEHDDYISLVLKEGVFKEILLADGFLVSLDPKLDDLIKSGLDIVERGHQPAPRVVAPGL